MARVNKLESNYKKPLLTPRNTGYAATGALILATTRAFSKNKNIKKTHKIIGYIASILTLLHIGVVEYLYLKHKKQN